MRGPADHPSRSRLDEPALARRLGGHVASAGLIEVTRRVNLGSSDAAGIARSLEILGAPADPPGAVFMDTETTGLAGGTGTLPFVLGIARMGGNVLHITQLFLSSFAGEPALLDCAAERIADATSLVTYNGKSFDGPLLATRYRLGRRPNPFASLFHVDLLHPIRSAFRDRWPDCRLRTVEERLLDRRRVDDLPGAEVPAAWFAWIHSGRPDALPRILDHNRTDLVSLAELLPAVHGCLTDPLGWGSRVSAALGYCRGPSDEARLLAYLRARRDGLDDTDLHELGRLARRHGDWRLAAGVWGELAASGDLDAIENLAKYHEHVDRDLGRALVMVERLVAARPDEDRHLRRRRRVLGRLAPAIG